MSYCILQLVCLLLGVHIISGMSYDHAVSLLQNKTLLYERSLRPVTNQSSTLVVNILFDLVSIQDFDEVQESLIIISGLTLTWTDEFMTWNPADYGGMVDIVSESGKFWTPNLILVNNVNKLDKIGESWQRIRFTHKGVATVIQADIFSTLCSVDVTYYPRDSHWCDFEFSSVAYSSSELVLQPQSGVIATSYFKENGAWKFIGSDVTTRYQNASALFRINLARKPLFALVNIILPIIALAFLNAIIFLIPADSGERISYSITVLLAVAVFLTLVGENLPKTSNPISIFSFYLLTILLISVAISLVNIFILRLYHRDNTESASGFFGTLTRVWQRKFRCNVNKKIDTINVTACHGMDETKESNDLTDIPTDCQKTVSLEKSIEINADNCAEITWKDVSVTLDKICLCLFISIIIIATLVFFMIIYSRKQ